MPPPQLHQAAQGQVVIISRRVGLLVLRVALVVVLPGRSLGMVVLLLQSGLQVAVLLAVKIQSALMVLRLLGHGINSSYHKETKQADPTSQA
jgi:hypothetical protein